MSAHFERAEILLQTGRPADAEKEIRTGLATTPQQPQLLHLLCRALVDQQKLKEAAVVADTLIGVAAGWPSAHLMRGAIAYEGGRHPQARADATEALRLAPNTVDPHRLLGWVAFAEGRWAEALQEAEAGLAVDPEETSCGNLRALALTRLGRKVDSRHATDSALRRDPTNAFTHATAGWIKLERGEKTAALDHFYEALRLDPTNERARAGLVEALKARNFLYRLLLTYSFWLTRLTPRSRWAVMLGGYFGYRLLLSFFETTPALQPYAGLVISLWISFVVFSWTGYDLFNLILLFNRGGRHALAARQKYGALALAGCLMAAAAWLVWAYWVRSNAALLAIAILLFAFPLTRVFRKRTGWRVQAGYLVTAVLGVMLLVGLTMAITSGNMVVVEFTLVGLIAYTWLGQLLNR